MIKIFLFFIFLVVLSLAENVDEEKVPYVRPFLAEGYSRKYHDMEGDHLLNNERTGHQFKRNVMQDDYPGYFDCGNGGYCNNETTIYNDPQVCCSNSQSSFAGCCSYLFAKCCIGPSGHKTGCCSVNSSCCFLDNGYVVGSCCFGNRTCCSGRRGSGCCLDNSYCCKGNFSYCCGPEYPVCCGFDTGLCCVAGSSCCLWPPNKPNQNTSKCCTSDSECCAGNCCSNSSSCCMNNVNSDGKCCENDKVCCNGQCCAKDVGCCTDGCCSSSVGTIIGIVAAIVGGLLLLTAAGILIWRFYVNKINAQKEKDTAVKRDLEKDKRDTIVTQKTEHY